MHAHRLCEYYLRVKEMVKDLTLICEYFEGDKEEGESGYGRKENHVYKSMKRIVFLSIKF